MPDSKDKKVVAEQLLAGKYEAIATIQRPLVVVEVTFYLGDEEHTVFSWAKVSSRDKWDKDFGVKLAIEKAAHRLAKKLTLSPEELSKRFPPIEDAEVVQINHPAE